MLKMVLSKSMFINNLYTDDQANEVKKLGSTSRFVRSHVDRTLLKDELNICVVCLTFIKEYGVELICWFVSFGRICNPHSPEKCLLCGSK